MPLQVPGMVPWERRQLLSGCCLGSEGGHKLGHQVLADDTFAIQNFDDGITQLVRFHGLEQVAVGSGLHCGAEILFAFTHGQN